MSKLHASCIDYMYYNNTINLPGINQCILLVLLEKKNTRSVPFGRYLCGARFSWHNVRLSEAATTPSKIPFGIVRKRFIDESRRA